MLSAYFTYYQIVTFFSLGFGIYLLLLVFFANPKKAALNWVFTLYSLFTLFWSTAPYFVTFLKNHQSIILYAKLGYGFASLGFILSYLLVVNLFPKIKRTRILDMINYTLGFLGFIIAITPFFIKNFDYTDWGVNPIFGPIKFVYFLIAIFYVTFIPYFVLKGYFSSDSSEKSKHLLFLIGFVVFIEFAAAGNVVMPLLGYPSAKYWLMGSFSPIFLIFFTTMAIFKDRAFGVKTILTDFLVGVLGIILLAVPFFFSGLVKIIGLIIFILFSVLGYAMIIYAHREAKQKEMLEEKVQERTQEIEKRKEDLEKFYSLTVGRELKMVELKKKIQELEEKTKI